MKPLKEFNGVFIFKTNSVVGNFYSLALLLLPDALFHFHECVPL